MATHLPILVPGLATVAARCGWSIYKYYIHTYFVKFPSLTHAKQPREVAVPREERLLHTSEQG